MSAMNESTGDFPAEVLADVKALVEAVLADKKPNDELVQRVRERAAKITAAMDDPEEPSAFRTLRGFLDGEEPSEENYFCFCATLRIFGNEVPFEEISERLGVQPTSVHRKGERRGPRSPPYPEDAWLFESSLAETEPLQRHIEAIWQVVRPHVEYLKALKHRNKVDVFCGNRSNCDMAGFEVPHQSLELFTALEVPFGVSVIVA